MSFSLIKDKNITIKGIKSYLIDSVDDIATLSTNILPGSTALIAGTKDTYTLNNSYEWIKEEGEGGGSELPLVTAEDNGKVLKVIEGEWAKGTDESLPAVTSEDAGKILGVTEQGEWAPKTAPAELPAVTADDNGKILAVNNGAWTPKSNIEIKKERVTITAGNGTYGDGNELISKDTKYSPTLGNATIIGLRITGPYDSYIDGYTHQYIIQDVYGVIAGIKQRDHGSLTNVTRGAQLNIDIFYVET